MNNKNTDSEIDELFQDAWNWLCVTSDATTKANLKFKNHFEKIAKRCIKEAEIETPTPEEGWVQRDIFFNATEEELTVLRNLHKERVIFKELHKEKVDAFQYVQSHKQSYPGSYRSAVADLVWSIVKGIFYCVVFVAALVVIVNAF